MKINKILLSRTDRIGDVILTTPAITLLRKQYPEAGIFFLTRSYTAPLLAHQQDLDGILIYEPDAAHRGFMGARRLGKMLKKENFDLAVLFYPQADLALALKLAGIPLRAGTGYRWYSFLLNHRIYQHRKHGERHELEYNLQLLRQFVEPLPAPQEIRFNFEPDANLQQLRQEALKESGIQEPYLMVHPGSGGSAPNLPPQMFAKICSYLAAQTGMQIVLSGSRGERALIDGIAASAGSNAVKPAVGLWNLETLMAVIAGSRFFIANSTGPLHIARAFDIPLLGFYCPAVPCAPRRWGPYNRPGSVIMPEVIPCQTCNPQKCPHGNCLAQITWDQIKQHLDRRFAEI